MSAAKTPNNLTDNPKPDKPNVKPSGSTPVTGVFKGRLNRLGMVTATLYWSAVFFVLLIVFGIVASGAHRNTSLTPLLIVVDIICGLFVLLYYVMFIGIIVRRLHDLDQSGLLALLLLIPFFNSLFTLALYFIPGSKGPNRFGESAQPSLSFFDVNGVPRD